MGTIEYENNELNFVFDGKKLRLTFLNEKESKAEYSIFMTKTEDGGHSPQKKELAVSYLIGKRDENYQTLVFLISPGTSFSSNFTQNVWYLPVAGYIVCHHAERMKLVSKVTFASPELDCIYPVNEFFTSSIEEEGNALVKTDSFNTTKTAPQIFKMNEKEVEVKFCIDRYLSHRIGQPPLTLRSRMVYSFEATDDYSFILDLWRVAKAFIKYMCYRQNVSISSIQLYTPEGENKLNRFGELYVVGESKSEELEILEKGKFILLSDLCENEGKILSDLAEMKLYTRHIPDSYRSGLNINAARFVMITAAFEWEFKRLFKDNISKKEKEPVATQKAIETIQTLVDENTGKLKKVYKHLLKILKTQSTLEQKVLFACDELDSIVGDLDRNLYKLNGIKIVYSEIATRIAQQRNNFAHGNLDEAFIGESLLDVIFLERIVYAMQLKYHGVDDFKIKKVLEKLFS